MSRYFQSSYHGSNDYRKYREERLGKNIDIQMPNEKKYTPEDFSYRPQSRKNAPKEHLQTFGKQISYEESKNHNLYEQLNLYHRQTDRLKRPQTSRYDGSSFLSKKGLNSEFDVAKLQEDKISIYMKDTYAADKRPSILNQEPRANAINAPQPYQSSRGNSRQYEKYSRPQETLKDLQVSQDFENSIITRRRNYDNLKDFSNQGSYLETSSKTYNYSSKLKNRAEQVIDSKPFEPKQRGSIYASKYEEGKYKASSVLLQKTPSTSPYRSRNQMIKERLNMNENRQEDFSYRSFKRDFDPIDEPSQSYQAKRQFIPSQIRTAHVTPQKSNFTPRQDKNASQQRRKSLIEKSQMLKEKLNKLNASSNTKGVENQQTRFGSKANQKQNIAQSYTPKRYMTNSFRVTNEDSGKVDRSVSKKLNFEEATNRGEPLKTFDKNTNEVRQSSKSNYANPAAASGTKEPLSGETTGEGALRKISELNERINSRLESILKNYG